MNMSVNKKKRKKFTAYSAFRIFNVLFMLFIIFITAYPVYYIVIASFSDPVNLSKHIGMLWLPLKPFTSAAYEMVFATPDVVRGFFNTLFILVVGLAVNLTLTALGAFFLTIKGPKLRNAIAMMIVFSMYFGGGMIPAYLNIKELGLLDTHWALILPTAISTSNLIIMKSAFQSIPDALIESARIDGAKYWQVLLKIMIPLSKATMAVMVLYYGVAHWNSWFSASIYLRDSSKYPLQLVVRNILKQANDIAAGSVSADTATYFGSVMKYALIVVTTTPILVLYPFLQKYFVKGVMIGSVKG